MAASISSSAGYVPNAWRHLKGLACSAFLMVLACESSTPPEPEPPSQPAATAEKPAKPSPAPPPSAGRGGDPEAGDFTLEEALAGLDGSGDKLVASLETDAGTLKCDLWPDKAPITVANFVGLARGTRAWREPGGQWVRRPLYDGTKFHRIIKGFMIQGGDPLGTGQGGPGYEFKDEHWSGATHDRRGLLCMANRGPNTNGSQFFVMDGSATHLDRNRSYTIFGECGPAPVIQKLSASPPSAPRSDRPANPPVLKKVTISRG